MISGANADFTTMCIDLDMLNYDSGKSLDDDSKKMLRANGLLILCALATSQVLLPKSLPKGECASSVAMYWNGFSFKLLNSKTEAL